MSSYKIITIENIYSMLTANEYDRKKAELFREKRDRNYNPYPNGFDLRSFANELNSDYFVDGFIMGYPHGTVVRQAQRSFYYRGENQLFDFSKASLYRKLCGIDNDIELMVEEFVAYMRIADFLDLLLQLEHTQKFISQTYSFHRKEIKINLLYEQLAQHYGFETCWLDITSDFEVALFFACCKFDNSANCWKPLNRKDFKQNEKKRYGVVFQRSFNPILDSIIDSCMINVYPVGFQPFMRCHMQNSYVALMDKHHCLQKDSTFSELRFKHDENLSSFIYKRMDSGKKIYPHEGLNLLKSEIESLKQRSIFSRETFEYTCGEYRFKSIDKNLLKKSLTDFGYKITNSENSYPKEKINMVDESYRGFDMEKDYKIRFRTRLSFST